MIRRRKLLLTVLLLQLLFGAHVYAQQSDPSVLTLDRIFSSREFRSESFGPARWIDDGRAYTTLEPSATDKDARDTSFVMKLRTAGAAC
jgi:dipeptidyl-peptidase-4